jgi:hypothetical protein
MNRLIEFNHSLNLVEDPSDDSDYDFFGFGLPFSRLEVCTK